jgi:hypothetical protein
MYETLGYKVFLFAAVGALVRRAVDERDVGADERGTGAPLRSVRRNFTEEDQHRKALAKLILFEVNPGRPILDSLRGPLYRPCCCGCMRRASSAGERMNASRRSLRLHRSRSCRSGWRWCRRSSAGSRRLCKEADGGSRTALRRDRSPAIMLIDIQCNCLLNRRCVARKIVEFWVRVLKRFGRRSSR